MREAESPPESSLYKNECIQELDKREDSNVSGSVYDEHLSELVTMLETSQKREAALGAKRKDELCFLSC